jgi:hypothetical protein
MCTVSLLGSPSGYLLVHNRDESLRRPRAEPPRVQAHAGDLRVLAPLDPEGRGTWIGVNSRGLTVCVLNGDRPPAAPLPEVPESRGLVAAALLGLGSASEAAERVESWNRSGRLRTRPFHLMLASPGWIGGGARFEQVSWDGASLRRRTLDVPYVATSSTADPDGAARARGDAFRELLPRIEKLSPDGRRETLALWHAQHLPDEPEGGPLSVCMHRADARTVSRTVVDVGDGAATMLYHEGWPCRPGPESASELPLSAVG